MSELHVHLSTYHGILNDMKISGITAKDLIDIINDYFSTDVTKNKRGGISEFRKGVYNTRVTLRLMTMWLLVNKLNMHPEDVAVHMNCKRSNVIQCSNKFNRIMLTDKFVNDLTTIAFTFICNNIKNKC